MDIRERIHVQSIKIQNASTCRLAQVLAAGQTRQRRRKLAGGSIINVINDNRLSFRQLMSRTEAFFLEKMRIFISLLSINSS